MANKKVAEIYELKDENGTYFMMRMYVDGVGVDHLSGLDLEGVYNTIKKWRKLYGVLFARFMEDDEDWIITMGALGAREI